MTACLERCRICGEALAIFDPNDGGACVDCLALHEDEEHHKFLIREHAIEADLLLERASKEQDEDLRAELRAFAEIEVQRGKAREARLRWVQRQIDAREERIHREDDDAAHAVNS